MSANIMSATDTHIAKIFHIHHNEKFYDEVINHFFEKHIRLIIAYFEFRNIIESPNVTFDELRANTKSSQFKDTIIEKYNVQYHVEKNACVRDIDVINYLIDFMNEGYCFGKQIMLTMNENKNANAHEHKYEKNVSDNTLTMTDGNDIHNAINKITTIARKYATSVNINSHKQMIQFIIDQVSMEIIKGIKGH
jgi:hypothetical protein